MRARVAAAAVCGLMVACAGTTQPMQSAPEAHPVMQEPPPADVKAVQPQPRGAYVCLPGIGTPVRVQDGEVDCAAPDGRNCLWDRCTAPGPWAPSAGETLAPLVCGEMHLHLYAIDGYGQADHWCRAACLALDGCAHVEQARAPVQQPPAPAPPPHFVPPRPGQSEPAPRMGERAKPEPISSEASCQEDADCVVEEHRSCCGCQGIRVRAKGVVPREPACGCADYSAQQLFGGSGPCGPMPPPVSSYRARCVKHRCAGVVVP